MRLGYIAMTETKYVCLTIYGDYEPIENKDYSYAIYGKEICPETKRSHWQVYIESVKRHRISWYSKRFNNAHVEIRKGTGLQASEYCKKDGEYIEFGELSGEYAGKRNDLLAIKKKIDEGKTMIDIADNHFESFIRFNRGFSLYKSLKTKKRDFKTHVTVFYGLTGTGKSRRAFEMAQAAESFYYVTITGDGPVWWNGYEGQELVVINDYLGEFRYRYILQLLDRYPIQVPTKGNMIEFTSKSIIFTSSKHPSLWYINPYAISQPNELLRRIEVIEELE